MFGESGKDTRAFVNEWKWIVIKILHFLTEQPILPQPNFTNVVMSFLFRILININSHSISLLHGIQCIV